MFQEELLYIPTKLEFEEISLDTPGYFSYSDSGSGNTGADSTDTLDATIHMFVEMENIIKENFMMPKEKLEQFAMNNPVQCTLRDQVEQLHKDLVELTAKHKKMTENFYSKNNKENENKNQQDQQSKIDSMQTKLMVAEMNLQEMTKDKKNLDGHQTQLRA